MLEHVKSLSNIVLVSTRSSRIPIISLHMETMLSGYCEVLGAKMQYLYSITNRKESHSQIMNSIP